MNAALSLNTRPASSLMEQVSRHEAFEMALRDKSAPLTQRIAELEGQLAFMASEQKLSLERGAEGLKREQALRDKVCQLLRENHQLKDTRDEFELAGNQLADDKEKLQAEVERLVVQDNAAARVLAKTQEKLKASEAEAKRLRALEPDRLKAQVKRLQKEKSEAVAGAKELRVNNKTLTSQNRQLNAALDKAIADANAGMELKPERVFEPGRVGRWELFTCSKDGWYQVLDAENEVSQTVRVENGELITPKVRPVPKAIAAEVLKFHQEYFGGWA